MKDRQIRARNNFALAEMELARQMGVSLDSPADPAATFTEPVVLTKTIDEWLHLAAEQRFRASRRAVARSGAGRRNQSNESRIRTEDRAVRQRRTRCDDAWWPIWDELDRICTATISTSSRVERRKLVWLRLPANASKAKHTLEWFRAAVQMEVRKAYLDGNAAAQRTV